MGLTPLQRPTSNNLESDILTTMDRKLLDILCCPITKRPLQPLSTQELEALNRHIADGQARYLDDTVVDTPLDEGLITDNGSRIYRVDDGIPVMLEERSIPGTAAGRD